MAQSRTKRTPESLTWYAVAAARFLLGFVFLWTFFDKLFGLHYGTSSSAAWIHGGSPTRSYLAAVHGPFAGLFHAMAGQTWVDWLFMIGIAGIGLALVLGIAVRIAVVSGTLLLLLMWAASLPIRSNPFVDEHVLYIALLWIIFFGYRHQVLSFGAWWRGGPARFRWLW